MKDIKYFRNNCPIKWEPHISKRCPRCYKCQEYKHLARNCFNKERCTRCRSIHHPDDCPKPPMTADMTELQKKSYWCHPCQLRGHSAHSLYCPTKLKYDEEQRERALNQNQNKDRVSAPYDGAWAEIEDTSKDLFGRTPAQMFALCEKFVQQTRQLDKHQKMTEYIRFYSLISKCGN